MDDALFPDIEAARKAKRKAWQQAYNREYYAKTREKLKPYYKRYREQNAEAIKAYAEKWRAANKERTALYNKAAYAANKEERKKASRDYSRAHPEPYRQRSRESWRLNKVILAVSRKEWRDRNKARLNKYHAKYAKDHPEIKRLVVARRRVKVRNGTVRRVTKADIAAIHKAQRGKCAICRKAMTKFHIDHIVPVAMGGAHDRRNFQLVHPVCNVLKGAKDPIDFARELGLLI